MKKKCEIFEICLFLGKAKRILDPSSGLAPPQSSSMPQNPYMYNQQVQKSKI